MTASALYVGAVTHRRLRPSPHAFRYRAFWMLLDLDEAPALARRLRLFSLGRFNLFSLFTRDHGDGGETPLRRQVEAHLAKAGVALGGGPIRMLFMPRTLGYSFNPLTVYFCHAADGRLAATVHQVHNTFGDRHAYVFAAGEGDGALIRQRCAKRFYVSPFLDMELTYEFRIRPPGPGVSVAIRVAGEDGPMLDAALAGRRRALTDAALLACFARVPAITLKVIAAIHWQALKLWLKGLRLRRRPKPPAEPTIAAPARARRS